MRQEVNMARSKCANFEVKTFIFVGVMAFFCNICMLVLIYRAHPVYMSHCLLNVNAGLAFMSFLFNDSVDLIILRLSALCSKVHFRCS